jgi:hypothetical protein
VEIDEILTFISSSQYCFQNLTTNVIYTITESVLFVLQEIFQTFHCEIIFSDKIWPRIVMQAGLSEQTRNMDILESRNICRY